MCRGRDRHVRPPRDRPALSRHHHLQVGKFDPDGYVRAVFDNFEFACEDDAASESCKRVGTIRKHYGKLGDERVCPSVVDMLAERFLASFALNRTHMLFQIGSTSEYTYCTTYTYSTRMWVVAWD